MLGLAVVQIAARIAGICQRVVPVMGQREIAGAELAELAQAGDVGANGEPVLHRRDDGEDAGCVCRFDLGDRRGDAGGDAALGAAHGVDGVQHGNDAVERCFLIRRGARGLRHVGGETGGAEAAAQHFRQFHAAV
jgi:hypothetical protein